MTVIAMGGNAQSQSNHLFGFLVNHVGSRGRFGHAAKACHRIGDQFVQLFAIGGDIT
jgi:hypothetical protein